MSPALVEARDQLQRLLDRERERMAAFRFDLASEAGDDRQAASAALGLALDIARCNQQVRLYCAAIAELEWAGGLP
ncbi:MAG: hypothetical protein FJ090_14750 [Deltaproteobacteria bacterium]|nr:hypothetical protein [Deltaproteobacteria bacterium]